MHWNDKGRLSGGGQISQGRGNSAEHPCKGPHWPSPSQRGSQQPLCLFVLTHLSVSLVGRGPAAMGRTHALTWFFSWTEQKALRRSLMMDK